jgi:ABC-type Mn2+/Zn2+ transport system permease subunit
MNTDFKNVKWKLVGVVLAITLSLFYLIYFLQGLILIKMSRKVEQMYRDTNVPFEAGYVAKIALWIEWKAVISLLIACLAVGSYSLISKRKLKLEATISIVAVLLLFWFLRGMIK